MALNKEQCEEIITILELNSDGKWFESLAGTYRVKARNQVEKDQSEEMYTCVRNIRQNLNDSALLVQLGSLICSAKKRLLTIPSGDQYMTKIKLDKITKIMKHI
jgi:hypothetical protein